MAGLCCPHCGTALDDGGAPAGQVVLCPVCGGIFTHSATSAHRQEPLGAVPAGWPTCDAPPRLVPAPRSLDSAGRPSAGTIIFALIGLILFLLALIGVVHAGRWARRWLAAPPQPRPQTLAAWVDQLRYSTDEKAQREAAEAIIARGPDAVRNALGTLADVSADGNSYSIADLAIPPLVAAGPRLVPALAQALGSPRADERLAAAYILRKMGRCAVQARTELGAALADRNRWVRWYAAEALGNLGAEAACCVEAMIPLLAHPEDQTRFRAVRALGQIGPSALKAAAAIARLAEQDPDRQVRREARLALPQINLEGLAAEAMERAPEDLKPLIERLQDKDAFERIGAARAIREKGVEAADAIPALVQALQHQDKWLREAAAQALAGMGIRAEPFRLALERAAEDPEPEVRAAARQALEAIGVH